MTYSLGLVLGPYLGSALVTAFGLPWALGLCSVGYVSYLLVTRNVQT
jgi:hypothetical protein